MAPLFGIQAMEYVDGSLVGQLRHVSPLIRRSRGNPSIALDDLPADHGFLLLLKELLHGRPDKGRPRYPSLFRMAIQ
jgi:hypothetical protein